MKLFRNLKLHLKAQHISLPQLESLAINFITYCPPYTVPCLLVLMTTSSIQTSCLSEPVVWPPYGLDNRTCTTCTVVRITSSSCICAFASQCCGIILNFWRVSIKEQTSSQVVFIPTSNVLL